ncbi:MAG: YggS family pyridoxal phosphate-dependent enzyme [bacterium]|nr:YggS family pyridoxal phosphate-dependent enzyme [bacterium]
MSIIKNYNEIKETVARIALSVGRNPEDIKIVAVSKTFSQDIVQEAIDSGISLFGENKIQEAGNKIPGLSGSASFHMIGHLQSNKAKDAVELFDVIQTIDKVSTALKINKEAEKRHKIQKILIQVNTSGEETKSGISPEKTVNIIKEIAELNNTEILGLMTMAPFTDDHDRVRNCFRTARRLLDTINDELNLDLKELSMGMSSDFTIAIEEGATLVRIGTAIFGKRTCV